MLGAAQRDVKVLGRRAKRRQSASWANHLAEWALCHGPLEVARLWQIQCPDPACMHLPCPMIWVSLTYGIGLFYVWCRSVLHLTWVVFTSVQIQGVCVCHDLWCGSLLHTVYVSFTYNVGLFYIWHGLCLQMSKSRLYVSSTPYDMGVLAFGVRLFYIWCTSPLHMIWVSFTYMIWALYKFPDFLYAYSFSIHTHPYTQLRVRVYMYMYIYTATYTCIHVHAYTCTFHILDIQGIYTYIYIYTHIYIYICIYIYIYIYICI